MDKGPYLGIVVSNDDPEKLGRIKANVPHVFGISDSGLGTVGATDIPWALPAGLPAGGTQSSGGMDWLPIPGDQVLVFFLDGEPEKPVWMWLMQTLTQQASFPLHQYQLVAGALSPTRGALTRYGHSVELNSGSALISTKSGYQLFLLNGDLGLNNGQVLLQTPTGQFLEFDDTTHTGTLNVLFDCYMNIGSTWQAMAEEIDFETLTRGMTFVSGQGFSVDAGTSVSLASALSTSIVSGTSLQLESGGAFSTVVDGAMSTVVTGPCSFEFTNLLLGAAATSPYVLGDRLLLTLNLLLVYLAGHTHSNGNLGSPTGPPTVSPQQNLGSILETILSTTILGQP